MSATSAVTVGFQAEAAKAVGVHGEGAKAGTSPKKSGDPKNATPRLCFFDSDFSSAAHARADRSTIYKSTFDYFYYVAASMRIQANFRKGIVFVGFFRFYKVLIFLLQ